MFDVESTVAEATFMNLLDVKLLQDLADDVFMPILDLSLILI